MSFFGGDFFKGTFFKEPFFGNSFFQEPFFDDTTVSNALTAGTLNATSILIAGSRTVTGTVEIAEFIITVDGVDNPVLTAALDGKNVTVGVADGMNFGDIIRLTHTASIDNNMGIIDNHVIVNDLV